MEGMQGMSGEPTHPPLSSLHKHTQAFTVWHGMQGVDDADVAAMGYAQLHTGISPTSAMQVMLPPHE